MRRGLLSALTLALEIDDEVDLGLHVFLLLLGRHLGCDANASREESEVSGEETKRGRRVKGRVHRLGRDRPRAIHVTFAIPRASIAARLKARLRLRAATMTTACPDH